jgi:3-oxoacyl-[acyl-carrier protein] reductase
VTGAHLVVMQRFQVGVPRHSRLEAQAEVEPFLIPVERHADVAPEIRDAYLASVPAGRMGTPEDIACAASFFASEEAGFITGQRIVVDGGRGLGP